MTTILGRRVYWGKVWSKGKQVIQIKIIFADKERWNWCFEQFLKLRFKLSFSRLYSLEEGCYPAVRHQVPQYQVFLSLLIYRYHEHPYYSQVRQFFATKSNNVRLIKSIYKPEFVSILLPNLTNWSDFNCKGITSKRMCNFWSDS